MEHIDILDSHTRLSFPPSAAPLLEIQRQIWLKNRPLTGITILHNTPTTLSTVVKITNLLCAGANVTVTNFSDVPAQDLAIAALQSAGIPYIADHKKINASFDIALDCGAEVLDMPNVKIERGIAELTQSGGQRYKALSSSYPIIDVDASKLKNLECMYGTGDGFLRAIKTFTTPDLTEKSFVIFGFGKVGKGIARYLASEGAELIIVDMLEEQISLAKKRGYRAIHGTESTLVKQAAKNAFCIVTATGQRGILSTVLTPNDIDNAWIANMGAQDEIGDNFTNKKILGDKKPLNFCLTEPTKMKFLDPIFTAHNLAAEMLITEKNLINGYQPFLKYQDEDIIAQWEKLYPEFDISDIKYSTVI